MTVRAREVLENRDSDDVVVLGNESCTGTGVAAMSREDVEPYLSALIQAEHLNVLVGSGLGIGLCELLEVPPPDIGAAVETGDDELDEMLEQAAADAATVARRDKGGGANLEDRLRVALEIAKGLERIGDQRAATLNEAVEVALTRLRDQVSAAETAIRNGADRSFANATSIRSLLVGFLAAFAGRTPTRDRLHVFTSNYDRVIEWGCEQAGFRVLDRFVGTLQPVFRSSRLELDFHYSPPGSVKEPRHLDGVLRLTKLHGSMDWRWRAGEFQIAREPVPFGDIAAVSGSGLLIYPNAVKDLETSFYPYADLFRDFSAAICRPNSVLVTYGYGYGDDHINRVIRDMLTIPSTHLLVIGHDDPGRRLERFSEREMRDGQVSILLGPRMASLRNLVQEWLPRPSGEFLLKRRARVVRDRDPGTQAPSVQDPSNGESSDET